MWYSLDMASVGLPDKTHTEYRMIMGRLLLEQGATYRQIHALTGLAHTTISSIKKGTSQTNQTLTAAIKKAEHRQLAEIGLASRSVVRKRLLAALQDENDTLPLSQVIKAQEISFQQRRTLEGEASIIYDHGGADARIEARQSRLAELQAERAVLLSRGDDGVYMAEADAPGSFEADAPGSFEADAPGSFEADARRGI